MNAPPPQPPATGVSPRLRALVARVSAVRRPIVPVSRAWSGAALGLLAATCACLGVRLLAVFGGWVSVLAVVAGVALGLARALAFGAVVLVAARIFAVLPARYRLVLVSGALVLWLRVFAGSLAEGLVPTLLVVVVSTVAGAAIGAFFERASRRRALVAAAALAGSLVAAGLGLRWLLGEGADDPPAIDADARSLVPVAPLDLPDPGLADPGRARLLFYGSGVDRRRPEYGAGVDLRTRPVDGRAFLPGWKGRDGALRTRYVGFDAGALPIDGRLWLPEGEGPFPLVLVVHGGHPMEEASEPGYDYLGEHLAGHGFMVALVDENFLNAGPWTELVGGLTGDSAARGWLVLEHLRAFRAWNDEAGGRLHGKVDLHRIALAGHSRGGEAVALAALFNKLPCSPDDATVRFDDGFEIRALVALATTDRQYLPGGAPTALEDLDYLALQGSNDGDVESFAGVQQLERIKLTGAGHHFKAAVYVHRANHGQWNRVWGRRDKIRFPRRLYLNRRPLLAPEAQERVARAYVTAFLMASLRGDGRYLPFLRDHRAGKGWLPDTIYESRFEDSSRRFVSRFEEDVDLTTTTIPGGRLAGEGLTVWREQAAGASEGRAAFLGWDTATGQAARYSLELPEGGGFDPGGALVFELADANEPPNPRGRHAPGRSPTRAPRDGAREPIDLTVELVDAAGRVARVPLSAVRLLQPQLVASVWKPWLGEPPRREIVFQTYELPLAAFVAASPGFEAGRVRAVRLVFDRTPAGVIVLDDVGFAPAAER